MFNSLIHTVDISDTILALFIRKSELPQCKQTICSGKVKVQEKDDGT